MKRKVLLILIVVCITHQLFADHSLRKGKDFALFFAVKDYDEWPDLRNPISDAEAVASELEKEYDFKTEIIRNPNRNLIYQTLRKYQKQSFAADGQLFIFFTGHGEFVQENSEGYFIPKDGQLDDPFQDSYLPLSRIKKMINNIQCDHILLAIDACYSGTIDESLALDKGRFGQRPGETTDTAQQAFIRKTLEHKTRLFVTSGGKERTPDGVRYSPFTKQFLEGLRNYSQVDGILTFWELLGYLKNANPQPRHGEFGHHEPGGNFLFVSKSRLGFVNTEINSLTTVSLPKDPAGKTYKTVKLNSKTWLQENLNYDIGVGSWCYDDKPENCQEYGRLYTWEAAKKACAALGDGWRLPTDEEWKALAKFSGGYYDFTEEGEVGDQNKGYETLTSKKATGFAALLGAVRSTDGEYGNLGRNGGYWSATERDADFAKFYWFNGDDRLLIRLADLKSYALSCRCIQN